MFANKPHFNIKTSQLDDSCVISVGGSFSFESHEQFRNAYESYVKGDKASVQLDLSAVEHVDSAALGMLVIMHEHLRERGIKTEIISASPIIRILIENCEFEKHIPSFNVH